MRTGVCEDVPTLDAVAHGPEPVHGFRYERHHSEDFCGELLRQDIRLRHGPLTLTLWVFLGACSSPPDERPRRHVYPLPLTASTTATAVPSTPENRAFEAAEALYVIEEDYSGAERLFEAFVVHFPRSPRRGEAFIYLGECADRRRDHDGSREFYEKGAAQPNENVAAHAHLKLGEWYARAESFREAIQHFERTIQLAVDSETRLEAQLKIGIALQKMGNFSAAKSFLERCSRNIDSVRIADLARYRLQVEAYVTVQVGAFGNREHALQRAQVLRAQHIEAEVLPPTQRGNPYFRVISGRFTDRSAARERLRSIEAILVDEKPFIVP